MLKKVLCMVIIVVTIMTTCAATSVSAANVDVLQTNDSVGTLIIGDVDLDGEVSIMDASMLQCALAGLTELSDDQWFVSNTTNSERVSVMDATEIQKYIAGLECNGCTGETVKQPVEDNKPTENIEVSINDIDSIQKAIAKRFIELVNEERAKVGVQPLSVNSGLTKAAEIRSVELDESFSHTRPDGTSCYTAIENRNDFLMMGENVAYNAGILSFDDAKTLNEDIEYAARFFFGQFKSSEGHYENMIREAFNSNGVGVYIIRHRGYAKCYMAHMFGETKQ